MKNVTLIGKSRGVFEGYNYFQLFFVQNIDGKYGAGARPYLHYTKGKLSYAVGCTEAVFDTISVGEVIDIDGCLFNAKNKLASIS